MAEWDKVLKAEQDKEKSDRAEIRAEVLLDLGLTQTDLAIAKKWAAPEETCRDWVCCLNAHIFHSSD